MFLSLCLHYTLAPIPRTDTRQPHATRESVPNRVAPKFVVEEASVRPLLVPVVPHTTDLGYEHPWDAHHGLQILLVPPPPLVSAKSVVYSMYWGGILCDAPGVEWCRSGGTCRVLNPYTSDMVARET